MGLTRDTLYDIASDTENKKYQDLRKAVLDLNKNLSSFDILRSGDDITLAFGFRLDASRADFRLFGNKHDYYRMAMGASLEETFRSLAKADPNVEALEAFKREGSIFLKLNYLWPRGTGPQGDAPETPAAAKPLPAVPPPTETTDAANETRTASRGGRRERGLVQPPPEQDPERNAKYFVPAKRSPYEEERPQEAEESPSPDPTAPAEQSSTHSKVPVLSPADRALEISRAYRDAGEAGTPEALQLFAETYPDSAQAPEARQRAGALREQQAYEMALSADTEAGYRIFLTKFPSSSRVAEIEARIRAVQALKGREEAEGQAKAEIDRRRREMYEQAKKLDDAVAYRVFLAAYPEAPEAPEVLKLQREAEADDGAFDEAEGSAKGLQTYLALRPDGRHAEEARRRLDALRGQSVEVAYEEALQKGTPEALEAYLKVWPKSPRAPEARQVIERLRKGKAETPPSAPPADKPAAVLTLAVPFVATPPAPKSRGKDPAWQSAAAIDLPVTTGTGPRSVRVKALHDGRTFYLLAQWNDATKDVLYRPWVWDGAKKTYRQSDQIDDGFAVALYRGKATPDSCMLHGNDQEADVWIWRAGWSDISGYAVDELFKASRERIPKANPYPSESGGQVWVREDADAGNAPWRLVVPVEYRGNVVPSYERAEPSGSRADVRASGIWESGTWTVEFSRALDPRHPDDTAITKERGFVLASFAVYDKSEKARHASTGLVRLELRGR